MITVKLQTREIEITGEQMRDLTADTRNAHYSVRSPMRLARSTAKAEIKRQYSLTDDEVYDLVANTQDARTVHVAETLELIRKIKENQS